MSAAVDLTEANLQALKYFHETHFPGQSIPGISVIPPETHEEHAETVEDEHYLGYYEDGARRTLTDEQIAMFRHSEIQRLLRERRRAQERQEADDRRAKRSVAKKEKTRKARDTIPTFQTDAQVHANDGTGELLYDEGPKGDKTEKPKKFQWPILGTLT